MQVTTRPAPRQGGKVSENSTAGFKLASAGLPFSQVPSIDANLSYPQPPHCDLKLRRRGL